MDNLLCRWISPYEVEAISGDLPEDLSLRATNLQPTKNGIRATIHLLRDDSPLPSGNVLLPSIRSRANLIKASTLNGKAAQALDLVLGQLDPIFRRMLAERAERTEDLEDAYTANLEGLVEVVEQDGESVFLMSGDNGLETFKGVEGGGKRCLPPPKEQLPFLLPRIAEVSKWYEQDTDAQLYEDLLTYHREISELPSEAHYDLLVAWDLHTYMLVAVEYSPILWLFAVPERGKSRTGKGMIYVARRGVHVESLRDAYLVRIAENLQASVFFDVMNLWKKAEREGSEDVLLLRFEKGAVVPRVLYPEKGPHQDIVYYKVFGPTIIGTNEPVHPILESRSVTMNMPETTRRFERDVKPENGLPFRERLTAFRARHLGESLPEAPKPARGRLGDILRPLVQIVRLVHPDREPVLLGLIEELLKERMMEKADSIEAKLLLSVLELEDEVAGGGLLPVKRIAEHFNGDLPERLRITAHKAGWRLKAMGFQKDRMPTGRAAAILWETSKIEGLVAKYGLDARGSPSSTPSEKPPKPPNDAQPLSDKGSGAEVSVGDSDRTSETSEKPPF